ncbi:uncharacterized protein LOC143451504 [Clavelina lepadiformis]|uniref:Uncharacterized protein n=1 Tax=Clavelina lepadiformis TaxID=159417 RepID=A0ABP0G0B2_CLALP
MSYDISYEEELYSKHQKINLQRTALAKQIKETEQKEALLLLVVDDHTSIKRNADIRKSFALSTANSQNFSFLNDPQNKHHNMLKKGYEDMFQTEFIKWKSHVLS